MDILRPGFERLGDGSEEDRRAQLEKEAVLVSLENLMTFPFVADEVGTGRLSLHGLWHDIGAGTLENFDYEQNRFVMI
jgi:carbonic anhydrase